jgi:REP element-mobilizing transposase RayT
MTQARSQAHAKWVCRYYIVWIPKCRTKKRYGDLRREALRQPL